MSDKDKKKKLLEDCKAASDKIIEVLAHNDHINIRTFEIMVNSLNKLNDLLKIAQAVDNFKQGGKEPNE